MKITDCSEFVCDGMIDGMLAVSRTMLDELMNTDLEAPLKHYTMDDFMKGEIAIYFGDESNPAAAKRRFLEACEKREIRWAGIGRATMIEIPTDNYCISEGMLFHNADDTFTRIPFSQFDFDSTTERTQIIEGPHERWKAFSFRNKRKTTKIAPSIEIKEVDANTAWFELQEKLHLSQPCSCEELEMFIKEITQEEPSECVWKQIKEHLRFSITKCGQITEGPRVRWKNCPFCGKRIRVEK